MDYGIFVPTGNNGWLISETAPQFMPSFDLARRIAAKAETYGFSFLLAPIKLRGFGGSTEFWDHNVEPFTLMAGLAAVTTSVRLFASVALPTVHPAIIARMASTIDDISAGRFGVNIVSGWNRAEFVQMGLWPGDWYFDRRYEYAAEYVSILREFWATGRSDFKGEFFSLDDCRVSPQPRHRRVPIVCAGQSDTGLEFCAKHGDFQFIGGNDDIAQTAAHAGRMLDFARRTGRDIGSYALYIIIADETDEAAQGRWDYYKSGADLEAITNLGVQASLDTAGGTSTAMKQMQNAFAMNIGKIVGSYETVANRLNEVARIAGMKGIMCIFDNYPDAIDAFGKRIMPLLIRD